MKVISHGKIGKSRTVQVIMNGVTKHLHLVRGNTYRDAKGNEYSIKD